MSKQPYAPSCKIARSRRPSRTLLILLLGVGVWLNGCALLAPEDEADEEAEEVAPDTAAEREEAMEDYIAMVERAQEEPEAVDYAELRRRYIETPFYQPYAGREQRLADRMLTAYEEGQQEEAMELAASILQHNYVSLEAHYVVARIYEERGDARRAERHQHALHALFDAIRATGDGESRSRAFQVISTREQQAFLSLYNLQPLGSELHQDELGSHDEVTVLDPDSDEEFELWFDVTLPTNQGMDGS